MGQTRIPGCWQDGGGGLGGDLERRREGEGAYARDRDGRGAWHDWSERLIRRPCQSFQSQKQWLALWTGWEGEVRR